MAEILNVQPEEAKEDPKYVEEMVAKAEGNKNTQEPELPSESESSKAKSNSDNLLAGKYKSEEDLLNGISELLKKQGTEGMESFYKQLEKGLGKSSSDESKDEQPKDQTPSTKQVEQALDNKGLSLDEFAQEYAENGSLSEDSYKKLSDAGITREVVDTYIAGQVALAEKHSQEVFNAVGGQETYQKMIEWAASNLSDSEQQVFNKSIQGTIEEAKLAAEGLYSRYVRANGEVPNLIEGNASASGADVYESTAQVTKDISDPRYKTDPAFRKKVEQKLGRSKILGVN